MKRLLTCATFIFLAVGCAIDRPPPATQDPAAASVDEAQLSGDTPAAGTAALTGGATPAAVSCDHPPTCPAFCQCDRQECLAEGNSLQFCGEEYTDCFHQFCLHECVGFGCGN